MNNVINPEDVGNHFFDLPIELIRPIRFQLAYNMVKEKLKFPEKITQHSYKLKITDCITMSWSFSQMDFLPYQIRFSITDRYNWPLDSRAYYVDITNDTITAGIYMKISPEFYDRIIQSDRK